MLMPAADRLAVYHTDANSTKNVPDWLAAGPGSLRARVSSMGTEAALAANAEGRYELRATHTIRVEPHESIVPHALLRRRADDKCFMVLSVQEANCRRPGGGPDHLICTCAAFEKPPELPDAGTQGRRDR